MVATPTHVPGEHRDPLVTRLAALEKTVAAIGNKTLYSASIGSGGLTVSGSGGVTVADANSVTRFQAGGSTPTVVRDAAGNAVYEDDATAGWGLRSPAVPVPLYQTNSSGRGFVTWTGTDFGELAMYTGQIYVDHPRLSFQYQLYLDSNGTNTATASARMTYDGATITGSTITQSTTSSVAPVVTGSILLPETDFGTLKSVQLLQHQTAGGPSGSADCFAVPRYVVLTGQ